MKVGDWVETPYGVGKVTSFSNSYTKEKMNAYVLIDEQLYTFAIHLINPLPKEVADVIRSAYEKG
jgi:hypothetical protein